MININNRDKVQSAIDTVQKRCKERTIDVEDILYAAEEIERYLSIPKKALAGVSVRVNLHRRAFPNSYRYTPYGTIFTLHQTVSGWFLADICRVDVRSVGKYFITLPDTAKVAILERIATGK